MQRFNQPTSGGNPFGNFNPMTTNNMPSNNSFNNFNSAFQVNSPFIEKTDFRNKNNFLHNNLNENLLVEQIIEYNLNIDSKDRSLTAYPNPFNFTVTFGGHGSVTENKTYIKKSSQSLGAINESKYETKKIVYEGTPGPIINKKFKNVKYLRLDYIILPRTNVIKKNDGSIVSSDCLNDYISSDDVDKIAYKYKYLMLRINEIKSDKILGTNRNLESDVFILYPDKLMGKNHIMWLPTYGSRNYKNSDLENISRLTFEILTPKGEQLYFYDDSGNKINIQNENDDLIKDCIFENMQMNLSIVMGVVENELNTNTKFEH